MGDVRRHRHRPTLWSLGLVGISLTLSTSAGLPATSQRAAPEPVTPPPSGNFAMASIGTPALDDEGAGTVAAMTGSPLRTWRPDGGCDSDCGGSTRALKATANRAPNPSYVLLFTGDTLVHEAVAQSARRHSGDGTYDFSPMFSAVAPLIETADLALCHLEVPLDPTSGRLGGWPRFSAPAEIATALAGSGFDGCSTASNHSLDRGLDGLYETLDVLDAAGLDHSGTARSPKESTGALYDLGGLIVGHASHTYGVSGARLMRNAPWAANTITPERIIADAGALRRQGAAFVVVSLHWGTEYSRRPSGGQRRLADQIMESPAVDLVVGHHPHVLQPVEVVGGRLVAYSLGNLLSNQIASCCTPGAEEGALLLVRIDHEAGGWQVGDAAYVPTWIDRAAGHIITPVLGAAAEQSRYRTRLARAAGRAESVLAMDEPGLSVADGLRWMRGLAAATAEPVDWHAAAR